MKTVIALIAMFFAFACVSEDAPAQSAQVLKGYWNDGQYSGSLQFSFKDGWKTGLLELWCGRGGTRVDFVIKIQSGDGRAYEVVKDSWPNSCGVDSFNIRPDAKGGWEGDISATYQTKFSVK